MAPISLDKYTYYYHPDEQGSTLYITDETAIIKNHYFYDAFGNVLNSEELVHNRITYVGQQFDSITQQYYLRARYYNPIIDRFTQEDIYRGDGLNLYAYCENNPVIYYDPSGYSWTFLSDIFNPKVVTNVEDYIDPSRLNIPKATTKRGMTGIATGNFTSSIDIVTNTIRSADKTTIAIPKEVAQQLQGRQFSNFDEFREELWKAIGNSKYANEFNLSNQKLMKAGKAPYAPKSLHSSWFGGKYNIDHSIEIQDGGYVYDMDNMSILAPKTHEEKTKRESKERKAKCSRK